MTLAGSRYLPFILGGLTVAALAGAVTLSALHNPDASWAWTMAATFGGVLAGVHIPAPVSLSSAPVLSPAAVVTSPPAVTAAAAPPQTVVAAPVPTVTAPSGA